MCIERRLIREWSLFCEKVEKDEAECEDERRLGRRDGLREIRLIRRDGDEFRCSVSESSYTDVSVRERGEEEEGLVKAEFVRGDVRL